jgi:hypothetical protein
MTSERWRNIEELFDGAQKRKVHDRPAFLAQACQGDSELRRQIEALLGQDEDGQVLDRPATELLTETTRQLTPPFLTAGQKLGYYEIASLVGAGGMGEVYRARDSRLRRDVAKKILPRKWAATQNAGRGLNGKAALSRRSITQTLFVSTTSVKPKASISWSRSWWKARASAQRI